MREELEKLLFQNCRFNPVYMDTEHRQQQIKNAVAELTDEEVIELHAKLKTEMELWYEMQRLCLLVD